MTTAGEKSGVAGSVVVAGVGASAGGLDALRAMFSPVRPGGGVAFVVVQHLDPTHRSRLVELLASEIQIPVVEAEDGQLLEADRVYVIPPDRYLTVQGGRLHLERMPKERGVRMSIDRFLRSLAEDRGRLAAGVILSGTGTDGTQGLKAIKAKGGLSIVQDPGTAQHTGMPESAIGSGVVDSVLPPDEIAVLLRDYARHPYVRPAKDDGAATPNLNGAEDSIEKILRILHASVGSDFTGYRLPTIWRRVQRRMSLRREDSVESYIRYLGDHAEEATRLARDLLVGVTHFFRDREAFEVLGTHAVPKIISGCEEGGTVRAWVPGCSTGEEAYSLAMLLLDARAEVDRADVRIQVFASDLDEDALHTARVGRYPKDIAEDVGESHLGRYFVQEEGEGDEYRVTRELRETVIFAVHNVISDPPFSRMDVVSCRNLLIYLRDEVQRRLIQLFHFSLRPDGYLVLGSSESIGTRQDLFRPVSKKWRIFRRIGGSAGYSGRLATAAPLTVAGERRHRRRANDDRDLPQTVSDALLERYAPPTVAVNSDRQVLYVHGEASEFLRIPPGEPTRDLAEMIRPDLRTRVYTLVQRSLRERRGGDHSAGVKNSSGESQVVRIHSEPIRSSDYGDLVLLTFTIEEQRDAADLDHPTSDEESLIRQLEQELHASREDLQSTIEELETSNEELKSANEELQSSNEELESSREELQSLNEELTTLNGQLEAKIDELEATSNDLRNLLSSTQLATVFLGPDLTIRRFTPQACKVLGLIDGDRGRPLAKFSHPLIDDSLLADCRSVLEDLHSAEARVRVHGEVFMRRVRPYRTEDNKIMGVVVTFTDVSELQHLADSLENRVGQQAAAAHLGMRALQIENLDELMELAVRLVRKALDADLCKVLELVPHAAVLRMRAGVGWDEGLVGAAEVPSGPQSQGGYTLTVREPVIVSNLEKEKRFSGPALLTDHGVVAGISCVIGDPDNPFGVLGVHTRDERHFTEEDASFVQAVANILASAIRRQEVEGRLLASEMRLTLALEKGEMAAWDWDLVTGEATWDEKLWEILGLDDRQDDATGARFFAMIHPEDRDRVKKEVEGAVEGDEAFTSEFRIVRDDRRLLWLASRGSVSRGASGAPERMLGVNYDVTGRKIAELLLGAYHAVAIAIAHGNTLADEASEILDIFGREVGVDVAELWEMRGGRLFCTVQRVGKPELRDIWEQTTQGRTFDPDWGTPGRVWKSGQAEWLDLLRGDHGFFRGLEAHDIGLGSGFAFPILYEGQCQGVVLCFFEHVLVDDWEWIRVLQSIGRNLGTLVERSKAEAHRERLMHELDHRVKNTLASVRAIATQTLQHCAGLEEFEEGFAGRLAALAESHSLLSRSGWRGAELSTLVTTVLRPYQDDGSRLSVSGPEVHVSPAATLVLGCVVHELATNASKYGALSCDHGMVLFEWEMVGDRLRLVWRERGGPAVSPSPRQGFGTRYIRESVTYELRGDVDVDFRSKGVVVTVHIPLRELTSGTGSEVDDHSATE